MKIWKRSCEDEREQKKGQNPQREESLAEFLNGGH